MFCNDYIGQNMKGIFNYITEAIFESSNFMNMINQLCFQDIQSDVAVVCLCHGKNLDDVDIQTVTNIVNSIRNRGFMHTVTAFVNGRNEEYFDFSDNKINKVDIKIDKNKKDGDRILVKDSFYSTLYGRTYVYDDTICLMYSKIFNKSGLPTEKAKKCGIAITEYKLKYAFKYLRLTGMPLESIYDYINSFLLYNSYESEYDIPCLYFRGSLNSNFRCFSVNELAYILHDCMEFDTDDRRYKIKAKYLVDQYCYRVCKSLQDDDLDVVSFKTFIQCKLPSHLELQTVRYNDIVFYVTSEIDLAKEIANILEKDLELVNRLIAKVKDKYTFEKGCRLYSYQQLFDEIIKCD